MNSPSIGRGAVLEFIFFVVGMGDFIVVPTGYALMVRRDGLRDDQWDRIKGLLPGRAGTVGRPARDNRLFVEAVLHRYRAGLPWRDLPERFGDGKAVHTRHSRWAARGVWEKVFGVLAEDADNEHAILDATIVRAHQHSAGARRGGVSRQTPGKASRSALREAG